MLLANVFVAGLCIMAVEMSSFRLLAPSFGTTQLLITNIIGTIMVALTIGYWLGGKLSDRYPTPKGIYLLVMGAAVLTGAIPVVSKPILAWAGKAVAGQNLGSFVTSLGAMVFLFAMPLGMLGMVSPYAIRTSTTSKETMGSSAGRIYSLATAGSIAGTYLPTLIFIPWLGTRATILIFSAVMLATGSAGLLTDKRGKAAAAAALILLACLAYSGLGPVKDNPGTLAEEESLYNYIHVVNKDGRVLLYLNEGHGYHSVYDPGKSLVGGVWDTFLALPAMATGTDTQKDILIIGLAAGTIANQMSYYWQGDIHIDGVEIDPKIVDAADSYFALDRRFLDVHVTDGRIFLAGTDARYDVIIVDAYKQPYIPFHLTTLEFFTQCREHLKPGGVLGINVATFTEKPEFLQMITDTMATAFPHLYRYQVDNYDVDFKNVVVIASIGPPRIANLMNGFPGAPPSVLRSVERQLEPLAARDHPRVLTDDWAPVEWYVDKTLFSFFN